MTCEQLRDIEARLKAVMFDLNSHGRPAERYQEAAWEAAIDHARRGAAFMHGAANYCEEVQ